MSIISDPKLFHPKFARAASALNKLLRGGYETGITKTNFQLFESYRHPGRQFEVFTKGTSKAGPYKSAHQFGLAGDWVPYLSPVEAEALGERIGERVLPGWNWHSSHDWLFLKKCAEQVGLVVPMDWDRAHVEHPDWPNLLTYINTKVRER